MKRGYVPPAYGKVGKRGKFALVLVAALLLMGASECGGPGDGRGGDSSWVGNTGVDGAMAAVPGNVAGGLDVLGQVLNK